MKNNLCHWSSCKECYFYNQKYHSTILLNESRILFYLIFSYIYKTFSNMLSKMHIQVVEHLHYVQKIWKI